jgi:hypothetical protein
MSKTYVKVAHLHIGAPALGGKLSLQAGNSTKMWVTTEGIRAFSKQQTRSVLIPWSNIVDCELQPGQEDADIRPISPAKAPETPKTTETPNQKAERTVGANRA